MEGHPLSITLDFVRCGEAWPPGRWIVQSVTSGRPPNRLTPPRNQQGRDRPMKTAFHALFALAFVLGLASSVLANVH